MQVPTMQVPWLLHVMSMHWLVGTSHSEPFQPLWHMQRPLRYWPFPLHSTGHAALKRADSIHPFEWTPPTIASKNSECVLKLRSDNERLTKMLKGFLSGVYYAAQITPLWHPLQKKKQKNKCLIPSQWPVKDKKSRIKVGIYGPSNSNNCPKSF